MSIASANLTMHPTRRNPKKLPANRGRAARPASFANAHAGHRAGDAAGAGGVLRPLPAPRDDDTAAQSGNGFTGDRYDIGGGRRTHPRPPPGPVRRRRGPFANDAGLFEPRRALLEKGAHRLARLVGGIGLGERVDAGLDGRAQIRVAPPDDQLLLEPDRLWATRDEDPAREVERHPLEIGRRGYAVQQPPGERRLPP